MSTKAGFIVAFLGTLSLGVCAELGLQGQTAAAPPQPTPASTQDSSNDLFISVGKSVLVDSAHQITKSSTRVGRYRGSYRGKPL